MDLDEWRTASPRHKMRAMHTRPRRGTNTTLLLCSILLCGLVLKGSAAEQEDSNFYRIAFVAFLESRAANYASIQGFDPFNVRVQRDDLLTKSLPQQSGRFRIDYLDYAAIEKQYKHGRKPVPLIVVRPMTNEGDTLIVHFTEYQVSVRGKRMEMGLEGGGIVRLTHDCEAKKFVVAKVELWGV